MSVTLNKNRRVVYMLRFACTHVRNNPVSHIAVFLLLSLTIVVIGRNTHRKIVPRQWIRRAFKKVAKM